MHVINKCLSFLRSKYTLVYFFSFIGYTNGYTVWCVSVSWIFDFSEFQKLDDQVSRISNSFPTQLSLCSMRSRARKGAGWHKRGWRDDSGEMSYNVKLGSYGPSSTSYILVSENIIYNLKFDYIAHHKNVYV